MDNSKAAKQLGIYIHIPFCVKKCDYCDFLSGPAGEETIKQYVEKLINEIQMSDHFIKGTYEVDTIFIGGGTPSIVNPRWIRQILDTVFQKFVCTQPEITIECNPGTVTEEKIKSYKEAGINRISVGLQSANDEELKLLGRIHTWQDFIETVSYVKKYFSNWNVDIMSALPGQSFQSYQETLKKVLIFEPPHISAYSLIIEEGTPFYQRYAQDEEKRQKGEKPDHLPDEDTERRMYKETERILKQKEYGRYEISNYAKKGKECKHNCKYWEREEYIGFGIGAASCIDNVRFSNTRDLKTYLQQDFAFEKEEIETLTREQQMEETMFLGLRMKKGVDIPCFYRQFSCSPFEVYGNTIETLKKQKLLEVKEDRMYLTKQGIDVSNYVLAQFLL